MESNKFIWWIMIYKLIFSVLNQIMDIVQSVKIIIDSYKSVFHLKL